MTFPDMKIPNMTFSTWNDIVRDFVTWNDILWHSQPQTTFCHVFQHETTLNEVSWSVMVLYDVTLPDVTFHDLKRHNISVPKPFKGLRSLRLGYVWINVALELHEGYWRRASILEPRSSDNLNWHPTQSLRATSYAASGLWSTLNVHSLYTGYYSSDFLAAQTVYRSRQKLRHCPDPNLGPFAC